LSIYATHWVLKFPSEGDDYPGCSWVKVVCQAVPAHIGTPTPGHGYESGDPYASFLPPAVPVPDDDDCDGLRAVVIIRDGTEKIVQEYIDPLLVLSGEEYLTLSFGELHRRICDALRGDRPRVIAEWIGGDGRAQMIFDDGSVRELSADEDSGSA
jgi:hypothetical protein